MDRAELNAEELTSATESVAENPSLPAGGELLSAAPKRLLELDLLKVVAIVAMILCHAVYMLGVHLPNYETDVAYFIGDYVFGSYLAVAHAFMFAMGVGIVFSKKNKTLDLVKRGIFIYVMAFVLNFFRYGIYALIDGLIEGQFMEETVEAFLVQDIFHFAGLALIFTGAMKETLRVISDEIRSLFAVPPVSRMTSTLPSTVVAREAMYLAMLRA